MPEGPEVKIVSDYLNKELSTDDNILLNKLKSLRLDISKKQRLQEKNET